MAPPAPPLNPYGIDHEAIVKALQQATRDALLEHARMGRPVSVGRDGTIVRLTPEDVFAEYQLDENGRTRYLDELPSRAAAALTAREGRRAEPLRRLRHIADEVHAAGLDAVEVCWNAAVTESLAASTAHDLQILRALDLGPPGEPGGPIRWDDPRLGPLWPDGEPEWLVKAQQACRDLEDQLADLPDADPLDPVTYARLQNRAMLDEQWEEGKLKDYEGEYIISDGETVFAHGRHSLRVWEAAQVAVRAAGKQPELLTEYFVMRS